MSTATQTRPQAQTGNGQQPVDEKKLLELMLDMAVTEQVKQISEQLDKREQEVEYLLPDFMKGQAKRLIKRARLTFAGNEKLQDCTPASFIKCVLQAAELGFAIDGRLCHAVPYSNKKKDTETKREWYVMEAQTQVDYKGMIAHSKRLHLIQDCWARLVYAKDHFYFVEKNGVVDYEYKFSMESDPGPLLGSFAVATHQDGWHRFEWMPIGEIWKIRARSKSWGAGMEDNGKGPWRSDPGEMTKKTPIKRLLKTLTDDAGLIRMFEIDDQDTDLTNESHIPTSERPSVSKEMIHQIITSVAGQSGAIQTTSAAAVETPRRRVVDAEESEANSTGKTESSQTSEKTGTESAKTETTKEQTQSTAQSPVAQDRLPAWTNYVAELKACQTELKCRVCYDAYFGENSTVEWTPEENTLAVRARDQRIAELSQPQIPERMRLLKEKIMGYKQPARLTGLRKELDADSSFSEDEKVIARQWIEARTQQLSGELPLKV